jgi:hypothetical protein
VEGDEVQAADAGKIPLFQPFDLPVFQPSTTSNIWTFIRLLNWRFL